MRRSVIHLGLAALVALGSVEALTGTASTTGGGDRWQHRLRLFAPEPEVRIDPDHPEWGSVLTIRSFDRTPVGHDRAVADGQVPLPVKVLRVAIPEGARVSLENVRATRKPLRGLRLGPVDGGGAVAGSSAEPAAGDLLRRNDGRSGPDGSISSSSPSSLHEPVSGGSVRLGQVGWLRAQRFVEVIYTPAVPAATRADGARDFDFYPVVEADLVVEGVDPSSMIDPRARPSADPHFEGAYRKAFVNYEEGRAFRSRQRGLLRERSSGGDTYGLQRGERSGSLAALASPGPQGVSDFSGATTPVYRIVVDQKGIYRLTWSYLLDPGTGTAPGLSGLAPADFKLVNRDTEVPIRVVTAVPGTFGPGDYLEFYGEGLTDEPKMILNFDFDTVGSPAPDIYQGNDFTDENVYFLFGESGVRARIPDVSSPVNGSYTLSDAFNETHHLEFDTRYVPNGFSDPFYQNPFLLDNGGTVTADPNAANCGYPNPGVHTFGKFLGPNFSSGDARYCQACDLNLPNPVATTAPATVRVAMRGMSRDNGVNPDHLSVVQIGTNASRSTGLCWDGESLVTQTVTVPQNVLAAGDDVYIGMPGLGATASNEALIVDWIEVDYQRQLKLSGGGLLYRFTNDNRTHRVAGFPTGVAADMVVYEITKNVGITTVPDPRRITSGSIAGGAGNFTYTFSLPADGGLPPTARRRFVAAGAGGFRLPVRVEEVTGEDLTLTTHEADMIVITTANVVDLMPGSAFRDYMDHRAADSGLTTRIVLMRDVYDSFSGGIETPEAIRSFLAYAYDSWVGPSGTSPPPAYVLLVGDISLDFKDLLGLPTWVNEVPTFVMYQSSGILNYYISDNHIAAFRGADPLPDVHLGRIPVKNVSESEVVFQKLLDYDLAPPPGAWRSRGIFLADRGKVGTSEADHFEELQNSVADTHFIAPFTSQKFYYAQPPYNGTDATGWRNDYIAAADAGGAVTTYVGHGAFDIWGGVHLLMNSSFLSQMVPTQVPTLLVNQNCLVAGFHNHTAEALGENYLNVAGKGAVAVLGPTGLSFLTVDEVISDTLYGEMFGLMKERRFGHLMTGIRLALNFALTELQGWVLLGDPAQRLILPAPRPPLNLAAISGLDAQVPLTWSPGPDTGVLTRIYRRTGASTTYTLLTPAGVSGTSFSDTSVLNGTAYFYRAVSVDPNGPFEGALSNTDEDCDFQNPSASGPGCVWARPLNPNPPAVPSGLKVVNPGIGDRLDLSWDANGEPDLLRYTAHFGTASGGPYPTARNVTAPATVVSLTGLTPGVLYCVVLTATNTSNMTSAPAVEACGIPSVFMGINPPDLITDLEVLRSATNPDSIELRWSAPGADIYGGPVDLASFSIYRGTFPGFVPDPNSRIAFLADPIAGSHTDFGAHDAPPNYFYLIASTDTRGFVSGAGRQLPSGITDLTVTDNGATLTLDWSAVGTTIDGDPTLVNNYIVYAHTEPASREDLDALTPIAPFVGGTSYTTAVPPGAFVYYSVIVVDVRGNRSPF